MCNDDTLLYCTMYTFTKVLLAAMVLHHEAAGAACARFMAREVKKEYVAVVWGRFQPAPLVEAKRVPVPVVAVPPVAASFAAPPVPVVAVPVAVLSSEKTRKTGQQQQGDEGGTGKQKQGRGWRRASSGRGRGKRHKVKGPIAGFQCLEMAQVCVCVCVCVPG